MSTPPGATADGSGSAFVALGLLSALGNRPRRDKIRETTSKFASFASVAVRFVLATAPESSSSSASMHALEEHHIHRDMVRLNISDTPFRCGFKYVLWFDYARRAFPTSRYFGAGDDDAYIQVSHFEMDLRNVAAQVGFEPPTLWGMIQWRSHYDKVTHDTSTGFMGWGCADAQAANVRRAMLTCRSQLSGNATLREALTKGLTLDSAPSNSNHAVVTSTLKSELPACASFASNVKRLVAVARDQVDWSMPPFPVANGPLFAVSRSLADLLALDLDTPIDGARAWVRGLESTPLAMRYWASRQGGGAPLAELAKRRCWPNSDSTLGLFVARAALRRDVRVTLVNTPLGVQHFPWPVYSAERGISNRSIVFHGAKRPTSRAWGVAEARGSGAFIPLNRTCASCAEMGWVTFEPSALRQWQCCGALKLPRRAAARTRTRSERMSSRARTGPNLL